MQCQECNGGPKCGRDLQDLKNSQWLLSTTRQREVNLEVGVGW